MNRREFLKGLLAATVVWHAPIAVFADGRQVVIRQPLTFSRQYRKEFDAELVRWTVIFEIKGDTPVMLEYARLVDDWDLIKKNHDLHKFYMEDMYEAMDRLLKHDYPDVNWDEIEWQG